MGEGPPNGPAPAEAGEGGPQTDSSARLGKTRPEPGPAAPSATRSSSPAVPCRGRGSFLLQTIPLQEPSTAPRCWLRCN